MMLSPTDEAVLAALSPVARELDARHPEGVGGEVMVTKAVVVFQYLDADGDEQWGYRRIGAHEYDLGGAAAMLEAAHITAWGRYDDEYGD